MNLLSLPNEILSSLPLYIDNIETFTSAASSCRRLRENFAKAHPKTILLLADASAPTFFSPHPHYLIAATARQVSRWALGNKENTARLRKVFQGGIGSLYDFCINNPNIGLTMEDIRRLHQTRFSIINRLADQIDGMAGEKWYQSVDDFWDGGVSEPATLDTEPALAAFQIIIYGELFASSMQAVLLLHESERKLPPSFDVEIRLDYIRYCIPDWTCKSYPGFEVLPTGPYAADQSLHVGHQVALRHILQCRRWRRMWAKAIRMIDENFGETKPEEDGGDIGEYNDESWSRRLYRNALQTQGLEGMQLVTLPKEEISKECRDQALQIKQQVELLQEKFDNTTRSNELETRLRDAPDLAREVEVCMASYWF
ncbi:hypothetical protein V8E54_012599 [Elaphomyces granulatus]